MRDSMFIYLLTAWFFILTSSDAFAINQWPDTGQTTCYDNAGGVVICDGSKGFAGQDGIYNDPARSYNTSTELKTVIDTVTMLQWYNPYTPQDAPTNYADAVAYVNNLNQSAAGGHADWRMPTIQEMATLIDASEQPWAYQSGKYGPFVMPTDTNYENPDDLGTNINDAIYWSLTDSPESAIGAKMVVRFTQGLLNDGDVSLHPFGDIAYVRPVRNISSDHVLDSFVDNSDGTVSASLTGLMWQQATSSNATGQVFTWGGSGACAVGDENAQSDALCYCEQSEFGGYSDWRLPNRNELQSLVDYSSSRTLLIDVAFPVDDNVPGKTPYYWSSTTGSKWNGSGYDDNYAVTTRFDRGFTLVAINKTVPNYVRCVRNKEYSLKVTLAGSGTGTVTSAPQGIVCNSKVGVGCANNFDDGTMVTLTAEADEGATFTSWSGGCTGTDDCMVTMDQHREITATFKPGFSWTMFLPAITGGT